MLAGIFYLVWFLGHTNNEHPLVEISWWPPQTRQDYLVANNGLFFTTKCYRQLKKRSVCDELSISKR